jgi:putative ABC transport system permease protein
MRLIFRNFIFVLKRFKASSILNILGLSVAFAVFFVIIIQTRYDFSFDGNFKKADNIYLISKYLPHRDVRYTNTNTQTPKTIAEKFPDVTNYCFINGWNNSAIFDVRDETGNKHEYRESVTYASEGLLDIFTPKIIIGNARQAFTEGYKAMLTKSLAEKFFGNEDPLGKNFSWHNNNTPITVVAVCEDFPDNCSLRNGVYMMQTESDESEWSFYSYIEISGSRDNRDKILNSLNSDESMKNQDGEKGWLFELTALPDIHLKFPAKGKGSFSTTVSLFAIGILLLIIAYINFVNFAVSMAPVRLKSLNIRRIMGENSLFLKFSIAMEAVFMSFIAVLVSILFICYFDISVVKEFFLADISFSNNSGLFILMAGCFLIMGFVAGIYPALYSTAFEPAMALSGSFSISTGGKMLKNTLIIIQFASAVILVIVSGFIKMQHDYMQDKSWGIKKENVVYLYVRNLGNNLQDFDAELKKSPDIHDITYTTFLPGAEQTMGWGRTFEGVGVNMNVWPVYHNYLQFFGINIVEGSDFEESDKYGPGKMIFNRTFVKKYEFPDIIGKEMSGFNEQCKIVGIMEDFNFESLREPVRPIAFVIGKNYMPQLGIMLVKINGQNIAKTLDYMQGLCKRFSSEPVEIAFLDETLNQLYKQENNLAKLISIFGLITIIVTVMGVYGLILFNVKSKRKTIAIHKIHGASITEVITMLNRDFIIQFAIAYIIAVPLSYIIVNRWLENFAYKTPVHWWIFLAGGLIVFIIMVLTVSWQSYKAASTNPVDGIKHA